MRKGFTLLELLIVIIIVGVLATIGFTQYTAVVERARGAEARQVLGQLRSICSGLYMASMDTAVCTDANLSISSDATLIGTTIPGPLGTCRNTHFFSYHSAPTSPGSVLFTAQRCGANGKSPDGNAANQATLNVDYAGGGTGTIVSQFGY